MKPVPPDKQVSMQKLAATAALAEPDEAVLRLRTIHRAASDLRRGTPVILTGEEPLVLLGAETASPRGLSELVALAAAPPVLLLAPMRAAAVLHRAVESGQSVVALQLNDELLVPGLLRSTSKARAIAPP